MMKRYFLYLLYLCPQSEISLYTACYHPHSCCFPGPDPHPSPFSRLWLFLFLLPALTSLSLCLPSRSFSQSHHTLQKTHQDHSLGHADTCRARHAGLWLRMLPGGTLCGSHGLPLHVGSRRSQVCLKWVKLQTWYSTDKGHLYSVATDRRKYISLQISCGFVF